MEHKAFFLLLVLLSFRYLPHWLNLFRKSNLRTYNTGDAKLTALQRKSESKCCTPPPRHKGRTGIHKSYAGLKKEDWCMMDV